MRYLISAGAVTCALTVVVLGGPVWDEMPGEAGSVPGTAQITTGKGPLGGIMGRTTAIPGPVTPDFEDMYLIRICDPGAFIASMVETDGGDAAFDAQLFLFEPAPGPQGFGLLGNDNAFPGTDRPRLQPMSTDGSGAQLTQPGRYYLAVSIADRDPVSNGGPIFNQMTPEEISGPDGPGGADPIFNWQGFAGPDGGDYLIVLEGTTFGSTEDLDCNCNGIVDACDILFGTSQDLDDNGIPDECGGCPGDLDGDSIVSFNDLLVLLASWGSCDGAFCVADLDCSGNVGFNDLLALLAAWGPCPDGNGG